MSYTRKSSRAVSCKTKESLESLKLDLLILMEVNTQTISKVNFDFTRDVAGAIFENITAKISCMKECDIKAHLQVWSTIVEHAKQLRVLANAEVVLMNS